MQLLVDRDLDLGLGVLGEADLVDRADRLAADEHLVAGHELAAGLEEQPVLVAAVAAEKDKDNQHDAGEQGSDPGGSDQGSTSSSVIRSLSLHYGTASASPLYPLLRP